MKKRVFVSKQAVVLPLIIIGMMWGVFVIQQIGFFSSCYGIIPWSISGLKGIVLSPFFHGSFNHLLSNTIPLVILLFLLLQFYPKQAVKVLVIGWLFSGLGVWLLPDFNAIQTGIYSCHIGASGVIYMLAFYLFVSGWVSKKLILLLLSIIVFLLYGGIVYGLLPHQVENGISWQGHLMGAVSGVYLAYRFNIKKRKK